VFAPRRGVQKRTHFLSVVWVSFFTQLNKPLKETIETIEFGTLFATTAQKQRSPPPRTNRAGVQKEGEKGKTTLTTTLTTTTSLVVVCVFKTLSQTREAIQNASFFKRRLSVVVLFKRAKRANASRAKRTRRPKTSSGRKVAPFACAHGMRAFSREFSRAESIETHTHQRERKTRIFFFLGLCTDYIPLSCLYRESNQKHVVEEEEEKKPTTPQEENCATTNSICNCNTNHGGGNHHERR
jgi:hypothetical protein